jgi:hypothetical protein
MERALNEAIQQLAGDLGRMLVQRNKALMDAAELAQSYKELSVELTKAQEKIAELEFRVDSLKSV